MSIGSPPSWSSFREVLVSTLGPLWRSSGRMTEVNGVATSPNPQAETLYPRDQGANIHLPSTGLAHVDAIT